MTHPHTTIFDEDAELYDAIRPTYPDVLVDAVAAVSPSGAKVLEIGAGTGQATTLFARRGYSVLALEPGPRLAALAARNLRSFPDVAIETLAFEEWPLVENHFDLVISATAFHWVDPAVRYQKTAQALRHGGCLAVFWNMPPDDDNRIEHDFQRVYERLAPNPASSPPRQTLDARIQGWNDEIRDSGFFGDVTVMRFPWSKWYDTEQYLQLLETYSDHRTLPTDRKWCLYDGIAEVLNGNGGGLEKRYVAALFLAQVR